MYSVALIINISLIISLSTANQCDCFNIKLNDYNDKGCYTYHIINGNNNDCDDLKNIILTACPEDNDLSASYIENRLHSITPKLTTDGVTKKSSSGLQIDTDGNEQFTVCFDNVNGNGITSDTVFIDGTECDFQSGLPCFEPETIEPSPDPTLDPTEKPSSWPTGKPTSAPTAVPTSAPTPSPTANACIWPKQPEAEIAILVDKTCGLTETNECRLQMEQISELLASLKQNNKQHNPKVSYIEIHSSNAQVIISLDNKRYQQNTAAYIEFIKNRGCGATANGKTDTAAAIIKGIQELSINGHPGDAMQKIVIVSNCRNSGLDLCDLDIHHNIQVVMINAIGGNGANRLQSSSIYDYELCLTDNDRDRICVANAITEMKYQQALEQCVPEICKKTTHKPTNAPTEDPTGEPTNIPSDEPTHNPSQHPTHIPTSDPTPVPTQHPTYLPSLNPTPLPSKNPTMPPTYEPTQRPTWHPSQEPTSDPSPYPTWHPSSDPTFEPTHVPTKEPTTFPTQQPTVIPTCGPSIHPTPEPSPAPTKYPTWHPTKSPTSEPTNIPTNSPTLHPTFGPTPVPSPEPTHTPTLHPTIMPSMIPTNWPTYHPTESPSPEPTTEPTDKPSLNPSHNPTYIPTVNPTIHPSAPPTFIPTHDPTLEPTENPTMPPTYEPTKWPTYYPTESPSPEPTAEPTDKPSLNPSHNPTSMPTVNPTIHPSAPPTSNPITHDPTLEPTENPTMPPTYEPTQLPTHIPTQYPTLNPTKQPTDPPTSDPTQIPTTDPTQYPSTESPTVEPTTDPTLEPTDNPSKEPTQFPSAYPTTYPTHDPTTHPTHDPTLIPITLPTMPPTVEPTKDPTSNPTKQPTNDPIEDPSNTPTESPTSEPSADPTKQPFITPTSQPASDRTPSPTKEPTEFPTTNPTPEPTSLPTPSPTSEPSADPTKQPFITPTSQPASGKTPSPTKEPTEFPTTNPTSEPTALPTPSPTTQMCPQLLDAEYTYEYAILFDNSCKISQDNCQHLLDGATEVVTLIKNDNPSISRLTYIEFGADESDVNVLIELNDNSYQRNANAIINYIKNGDANCGGNGFGETDLSTAIGVAVNKLITLGRDDAQKKIIIISQCKDTTDQLCGNDAAEGDLKENNIDSFMINFDIGQTANRLREDQLDSYEICIADTDKICTGNTNDWKQIVDDCLDPKICEPITSTPSSYPTDDPTVYPTVNPTFNPIANPTLNPTSPPLHYTCPSKWREGKHFEYGIVVDNSCNLSDDECDAQLQMIANILASVKNDDIQETKAAYIEYGSDDADGRLRVGLDNRNLQSDIEEYVRYIVENGNCGADGDGITDLASGLETAITELVDNGNDANIKKIIAINNCEDTSDELCGDNNIAGLLRDHNIELYMVNILGATAVNRLTSNGANDYKLCIVNNDADRICLSNEISMDYVSNIIEDCLWPGICSPNTESPTDQPTDTPTWYPTEHPSSIPTHTPTLPPTYYPSSNPTYYPTMTPTKEPTVFPTNIATPAPSDEPTEEPSSNEGTYWDSTWIRFNAHNPRHNPRHRTIPIRRGRTKGKRRGIR